jgi:hypothetical protein
MGNTSEIPWNQISAEVAAIVGSILLAFAIDAWWDDRREIEKEQRLLEALLVEYEKNSEVLREARNVYEQRYLASLRILELLQAGASDSSRTELVGLFDDLLFARTIHLESGVHDTLLRSGELNLIRDEALKHRLAAWPSYVREWSEEQDAVFVYVHNDIRPFLADSIRLREVGLPFASFPDGDAPPLVPASKVNESSIIDVTTSIEFDNLIYQRAQGIWYMLRDGETLLAQAAEITELIQENLER